jgi:hypothetical protein
MKRTLFCVHVLPQELEMLERFMTQLHKSFRYLSKDDNVTLKFTLNLNPELTDWNSSELTREYFISRFCIMFNGLRNINEVILDTSCWGTTQQKRDSLKLDYDQFIFCDTDIHFHEYQLKYQLDASYKVDGMYVISPSIPRYWDESWDTLVDTQFKETELGSCFDKTIIDNTTTQSINTVTLYKLPVFKFGCGMHTLYSKSAWELIGGIPESFGGYGPEDTYAMMAFHICTKLGYPVQQYLLGGIYITEDRNIYNIPSFRDQLISISKRDEFYTNAKNNFDGELKKLVQKLSIKNS